MFHITHKGCMDGGCCDYIVTTYCKKMDIELETHLAYPCDNILEDFENSLYDINGDILVLTDLVFSNDIMKELAKSFPIMVVIDHHKTARDCVSGIDIHHCEIDETHSASVLAWKYFYPFEEVPVLLQYVEDRDLWRNKLPNSEAVNAALWEVLDLDKYLWDISPLVTEGEKIIKNKEKAVNDIVGDISKLPTITLDGNKVPCVKLGEDRSLLSDIGHLVAKTTGTGICALYFISSDGDKLIISLRSTDIDVSEIAKKYSGGGYKNAAAFSFDLNNDDIDEDNDILSILKVLKYKD